MEIETQLSTISLLERGTKYKHFGMISASSSKTKKLWRKWQLSSLGRSIPSQPKNSSQLRPLLGAFPLIAEVDFNKLNDPISALEMKIDISQISTYKASGDDGFQAIFFHKCWHVVKSSIYSSTHKFFEEGCMLTGLNGTLIALIPKIAKPEKISQFCPISLCNVLYKVITKIMVNKISPILGSLIGPTQGSFLPGRFIIEIKRQCGLAHGCAARWCGWESWWCGGVCGGVERWLRWW
ncbi:LOW QUALITY PROTEIN: hypothetical protein V2J09_021499 [Rumex salicifolius]